VGVALSLVMAVAARAETARRVVLVVSGAPGDLGGELLARTRGELRAAHFDVETATAAPDTARRATVEREARRDGATAALGIFLDGGGAEIWVAGGASGRTIVQTLAGDGAPPDRRASVLAVKAVDLLKAALAEPLAAAAPDAAPTPARPPSATAPLPAQPRPASPSVVVAASPSSGAAAPALAAAAPPPRERLRLALAAGAGWLRAGDASSVAPQLALEIAGRAAGGRIVASGLGTATAAAAAAGTARLGQALLLAELFLCARPRPAARLCVAAGAGAYRLSVDGSGAAGFEGSAARVWSPAASAGAGAAIAIGGRFVAALDARAVGAWPSTVVRIDGQPVARAGGAGLWLAAGLGVRL
jgi:hypothetical protein